MLRLLPWVLPNFCLVALFTPPPPTHTHTHTLHVFLNIILTFDMNGDFEIYLRFGGLYFALIVCLSPYRVWLGIKYQESVSLYYTKRICFPSKCKCICYNAFQNGPTVKTNSEKMLPLLISPAVCREVTPNLEKTLSWAYVDLVLSQGIQAII